MGSHFNARHKNTTFAVLVDLHIVTVRSHNHFFKTSLQFATPNRKIGAIL